MSSRRQGTKEGAAAQAQEIVHDTGTGEVKQPPSPEDLANMADAPELRADDAQLPVLGWHNAVEVEGSDITSLGFVKLTDGFAFRGYVGDVKAVDSNYDSPIAGPKKQEVYACKGTVRVPLQDGGFGERAGRINIPVYAALKEAIEENRALETRLGRKIPLEIRYEGQAADRTDAAGRKTRTGRHLFRVTRIAEARASA